MNISHLIDFLVEKNSSFACWISPEKVEPQIIIDSAPLTLNSLKELNGRRGFVFSPFESALDTPVILLQPEIHLKTADEIKTFEKSLNDFPSNKEIVSKPTSHTANSADFSIYKEYVNKAITQLQNSNNDLSKVVLSRIIEQPRGNETLGELFLALKKANPNVFIYLINLPHNLGVWLGATPEILLSGHQGIMQTMSLAGTQALRDDHDYLWRAKEIEEQAFVSRYTVDTLNRYGIKSYQTTGPENYETSVVAHLKTTFSFLAKPIKHCLGEFVADLSPTPAVCGLPKIQAKQWITDNEPHNRDYYSGFLGDWFLSDDTMELFVNIRCLRVLDSHYQLFSGSGITAKSDILAEWAETDRKATTLLQVLKNSL